MKINGTFAINNDGGTVVLMPLHNLNELDSETHDKLYDKVLDLFEAEETRKLVVDLRYAQYFGSSALSFFVKLWQQVERHGGEMAFCNVSAPAKNVLKLSHLDTLLPVCESRLEALNLVSHSTMN